MSFTLRQVSRPVSGYAASRFYRWRTGTPGGQRLVLAPLSALIVLITIVSIVDYDTAPVVAFLVPILLGSITLRFRPLVFLAALAGLGLTIAVLQEGMTPTRFSTLIVMGVCVGIILLTASRIRTGLPGPLNETMLLDLRNRLYAQGRVPLLPNGWQSQSAMRSAGGAKFAGDFMVAGLSDDGSALEMVLVDVCGKGVAAGTQSLHFAGALSGLIGALSPEALFCAANRFLLRQRWDDGFATAVHVLVDLKTGKFSIINAGHPPALRWQSATREWLVDGARGTALGITADADFMTTSGTLGRGDALMFYTDGVVESRDIDVMAGITKLQSTAKATMAKGVDHAAERILSSVDERDDDCAVLILSRDLSDSRC